MVNFKILIKKYTTILLNAVNWFFDDRGFKMSAALAYNTIFSLGPLLFLIVFIGGQFYSEDAIEGRLYFELRDVIGSAAAKQIQDIVVGLGTQKAGFLTQTISVIALIIGATGVFTEIQDSLNLIWGVRSKAKKGLVKLLLSRLISFSLILGLGFLLIVSLIVNTILMSLSEQFLAILQINKIIPELSQQALNLVNTGLIFLVLSLLFSVIFRFLPDVRLKWKDVWPGAFLTTILFLLGKYLIGLYIESNKMATLYGAASSVIILLLWVYFSAVILYFGAEFTRAYIEYKGEKIEPTKFAEYDVKRLILEIEKQKASNIAAEIVVESAMQAEEKILEDINTAENEQQAQEQNNK
jgi:membrane protein